MLQNGNLSRCSLPCLCTMGPRVEAPATLQPWVKEWASIGNRYNNDFAKRNICEKQQMINIIPGLLTHETRNLALTLCLFYTDRRRGGIGGVSHNAANLSKWPWGEMAYAKMASVALEDVWIYVKCCLADVADTHISLVSLHSVPSHHEIGKTRATFFKLTLKRWRVERRGEGVSAVLLWRCAPTLWLSWLHLIWTAGLVPEVWLPPK